MNAQTPLIELQDIGLLGIENNRSRAYLQQMLFSGIAPGAIIYLKNPKHTILEGQRDKDLQVELQMNPASQQEQPCKTFSFRENEPLLATAEAAGVSVTVVESTEVNGESVMAALKSSQQGVWIYSGPGGVILRKKILSLGKRFLHVHPGRLPDYRGSTTIYYSILENMKVSASAIFLSKQVDEGDFIAQKDFALPADFCDLDYLYDPLIRSELLCDVLLQYRKEGKFETSVQSGKEHLYYIIHPVLKHLCILSNRGWNHQAEAVLESYPYIGHNPFEHPHKYTYSAYGGAKFLEAYKGSREEFLKKTGDGRSAFAESRVEDERKEGGFQYIAHAMNSGEVETAKLLRSIAKSLKNGPKQKIVTEAAEIVRRRFESRRLLFEFYGKNLTRGRGSRALPQVYVHASSVFQVMLNEHEELRYLNALLKLNDILLSIPLNETLMSEQVGAGVRRELEAVENISKRLSGE